MGKAHSSIPTWAATFIERERQTCQAFVTFPSQQMSTQDDLLTSSDPYKPPHFDLDTWCNSHSPFTIAAEAGHHSRTTHSSDYSDASHGSGHSYDVIQDRDVAKMAMTTTYLASTACQLLVDEVVIPTGPTISWNS